MNIENIIYETIGKKVMPKDIAIFDSCLYWYKGQAGELHQYYVDNGKGKLICTKKTMAIAPTVSQKWADLLLNEKTDIVVPDEKKDELENILKENNFWVEGNKLIDKAFGLGYGAILVEGTNLEANENGDITPTDDSEVKLEYINATMIYPISFRNGKITECAFVCQGNREATIQIHIQAEKGLYDIHNLYYKIDDNGQEELQRKYVIHTKRNKPLFHFVEPNTNNNIDINYPLPNSIFANCLDTLMCIDTKYDGFYNEYYLGQKRLWVSTAMNIVDENGDVVTYDPKNLLINHLPQDDKGNNLLNETGGDLRADAYVRGIDSELAILSEKCGLGKNYFTFSTDSGGRPIQTATAVISMQSDLFRTLKKHEILLEDTLIDLVRSISWVSENWGNKAFVLTDEDEITIQFDDSIIEDTESEKESARKDIQLGLMSDVEYRMKFYGETEEEAMEKILANPTDIAKRGNALIPLLQSRVITAKQFVTIVYGKEDAELEAMINEALASQKMSNEDIMTQLSNGMIGG